MKVLCIVGKGFEEGEALMPVALLRRAGVEVDIASLAESPQEGGHGITVVPDCTLDQVNTADYGMLFLPGGAHWQLLEADERVRAAISEFMDSDRYVAAICAAPTILGRMGYLAGRRYTCFTAMNDDFGGEYVDSYTVRDARLITGRSVAAAIDLGLAMIDAAAGEDTLAAVKAKIYY